MTCVGMASRRLQCDCQLLKRKGRYAAFFMQALALRSLDADGAIHLKRTAAVVIVFNDVNSRHADF